MQTNGTAEHLFAQTLMEIHKEVNPVSTYSTHEQEIVAMFDAFLGADYSQEKKRAVLAAQKLLHQHQAIATQQLENGDLLATEYVDRFNNLLSLMFKECESVLGSEDFVMLFGAPPDEMQGFIDKELFLQQREIGTDVILPHTFEGLPVADEGKVTQPVTIERLSIEQEPKKTILVVDDSKVTRANLQRMLERFGFRVEAAENGWLALGHLANYTQLPDLVLVDLTMPVMDGYELTRQIRRNPHTCQLPIIMISPNTTDSAKNKSVKLGMELLNKKSGANELVSRVHSALSR